MRRKLLLWGLMFVLIFGVALAVVLFRSEPAMPADAIRIEYLGTNVSGASVFYVTNSTARRVFVDFRQIEVRREPHWTNFNSPFNAYPGGTPFRSLLFVPLPPRSGRRLEASIVTPVSECWRMRAFCEEELVGLEGTVRAIQVYARGWSSKGGSGRNPFSSNVTYYGNHRYFYSDAVTNTQTRSDIPAS